MAQEYGRAIVDSDSDEDCHPFLEQPVVYTERDLQSNVSTCIKCSHVTAGFCMMALFQTYFLRVNFNVAMVAMLNVSDIEDADLEATDHCPFPAPSNKTLLEKFPGEFNWDASTQGLLLGSFFYGYCISVIPAGYLSTHYSAKYLMFSMLLISSIINLITPAVAKMDSPSMLVALRIILGLAQGPAFPCVGSLQSYWAAPLERTAWCAFVTSGMTLGTIIIQPLTGVLCTYGFDGGWPSVFYVTGIIGLVFCLLWLVFVFDTPNTHPRISVEEKLYLQKATGLAKKKKVPTATLC